MIIILSRFLKNVFEKKNIAPKIVRIGIEVKAKIPATPSMTPNSSQ